MEEKEVDITLDGVPAAQNDLPAEEEPQASPKSSKKKKKRGIITASVVAIIVVLGVGFYVWHEQPSFCNAICHTPMDPYNETYDQELGTAGYDKWGNEVKDTSSMLAVVHKEKNTTCMGCHVPTLSEQVSEGVNWVSGNYVVVEQPLEGNETLEEKSLADLVEARGLENPDEFCLNEACHNMTRDDLIKETSYMDRNPHSAQHGEITCSDCHKAHRASVNYCAECHTDAEIPDGWLSVSEAKKLNS